MPSPSQIDFAGQRVIILTGKFAGHEGICLGRAAIEGLWAVSPDDSNEVLQLAFEREFGLLVDLSATSQKN